METDFINDLLECPVCMKTLDQNNKVLPCQHTFCTSCLEQIVKSRKQLCCPECRIIVRKPVRDLPSNIMLIRIIDGLKGKDLLTQNNAKPKPSHEEGSNASATKSKEQPNVKQFERLKLTHHPLPSGSPPERGELWRQMQPMCVAIYDFTAEKNNDDRDCLSFKKNDAIAVLRQIDGNWAEGKLNGKIGIFPLSYVALNDSARRIVRSQNGRSGVNHHRREGAIHASNSADCIENTPASNHNAFKRRSLPAKSIQAAPIREGRGRRGIISNSHSMEINPSTPPFTKHPVRKPAGWQTISEQEDRAPNSSAKLPTTRVTSTVAAAGCAHHPKNPGAVRLTHRPEDQNFVIALFPYKAQKADELDLLKGDRYQVIEICNDGWCRGLNVMNNSRGVFPGNYTQPVGLGRERLLKAAPFHWSSPPKPKVKDSVASPAPHSFQPAAISKPQESLPASSTPPKSAKPNNSASSAVPDIFKKMKKNKEPKGKAKQRNPIHKKGQK